MSRTLSTTSPEADGRSADARIVRWLVHTVVLAVVYYGFGRLAIAVAAPTGYASAVWPAAGVAFVAVYLFGYRCLPGVFLGAFSVNAELALGALEDVDAMDAVVAIALAGVVGVGAMTQAGVSCWLTRRAVGVAPPLHRTTEVVRMLAIASPLGCLISASVAVPTLSSFGVIPAADAVFNWWSWWIGDAIGVAVVLPLALLWLGRPHDSWRRRRLAVALPLLLTIIGVAAVFYYAARQEQERIALAYETEADNAGEALEKALLRYFELLHSIQSLFASTESVSRSDFQTFVSRSLERIPGIQALGWDPRISHSEREALEAAARADGFADFQITERTNEGQIVRASDRAEYVPVLYIEPLAGNENAFGFDIYSNATRRDAIDRARDTGEAIATARITLVQETGKQAGMLVLLPIYAGGDIPDTLEARRSRLLGYAVGVFRIGDVVSYALTRSGLHDVVAWLHDESADDGAQLLASYHLGSDGEPIALEPDAPRAAATLSWSGRFDVGGRRWRLMLDATPQFAISKRNWGAWAVLAGGMLFTGLLGGFLLALTGRSELDRIRSEELARVNVALSDQVVQRESTERALQEEKERVEVTLHSIGDAVITTNRRGEVEYLNPVAEQLTGWNSEEAAGEPILDVFRILEEDSREPCDDPVERCIRSGQVTALAEQTVLVSRDGSEYAIQDSAAPIRDRDGDVIGAVLVFNDVTESRRMAREAAHHASHDSLTGLVNRREFERRLSHALASSQQPGTQHVLCYLDLDQFKIVNDTAGHSAGDELLRRLAGLLHRKVRERDTLARLGGDEFGLLLDNCPVDKACEVAETLIATVREFSFQWNGRSFGVGVSIGLVGLRGDIKTTEDALTQADVACYAAKEFGRSRLHVYQKDARGADPRHREILRAADMRNALECGRFRLFCQPVFSLSSYPGAPASHELLLRMIDDDGRLLEPGEFIPPSERYGLMSAIDRWVVRAALARHEELVRRTAVERISINLSGNSLNDEDLMDFLTVQFDRTGVSPSNVCFEITETAAVRNLSAASEFISKLRETGCQFALDDFGSGLSSFAYLKNLPVDSLKIDGSFVRNMAVDETDRALVAAVNQAAHTMGIVTVAEYADSEACVAALRELGVDYAQGYALGVPRPLEETTRQAHLRPRSDERVRASTLSGP